MKYPRLLIAIAVFAAIICSVDAAKAPSSFYASIASYSDHSSSWVYVTPIINNFYSYTRHNPDGSSTTGIAQAWSGGFDLFDGLSLDYNTCRFWPKNSWLMYSQSYSSYYSGWASNITKGSAASVLLDASDSPVGIFTIFYNNIFGY